MYSIWVIHGNLLLTSDLVGYFGAINNCIIVCENLQIRKHRILDKNTQRVNPAGPPPIGITMGSEVKSPIAGDSIRWRKEGQWQHISKAVFVEYFQENSANKDKLQCFCTEWIFCFQKIHVKESWRQALIIFNYQMMMSLCVWFHEGIVWLHVSQSWSHNLPFSGNKSTNLNRQLWPQLRKRMDFWWRVQMAATHLQLQLSDYSYQT